MLSFKANVSNKKSILTGSPNTELERNIFFFLNVIDVSFIKVELFWIYTSVTPLTPGPARRVWCYDKLSYVRQACIYILLNN